MSTPLTIEVELPGDLSRFRLPEAVEARLHALLDRQDQGQPLTDAERAETEGLVNLAELLTLLRLRAERASARVFSPKGWDLSAQGTALGSRANMHSSPKGWESVRQSHT